MGDDFLNKSFLFEIVDSATEIIEESFTLVIPPNAYSIKEKHRVTITKTFGNAFIDDYGADNLELTIRGISGTAHAFPTFQTSGGSVGGSNVDVLSTLAGLNTEKKGYTHKTAFYTFRDKIMRYRDRDKYDQKEMRVYDLADEQAYKCVLLQFDVDRTSEHPFHYPFTIQLFVYAKLGVKGSHNPVPIKIGGDSLALLDSLDVASDSLLERASLFENVQSVINGLQNVKNQLTLLRGKFNTWLAKGRYIIESPLTVTKQAIDLLIVVGGLGYDAYIAVQLTLDAYVNFKETIDSQIRDALSLYGLSIEAGAQQTKEETVEVYSGMDYTDPLEPVPTSSVRSSVFSGVNVYTVKGEDTLQSIALSELGDSELWPFIANANNDIASNADLVAGMEIYIPVEGTNDPSSKDSFILTEDTLRDPFGVDIRLDEDGNIVVAESNDVALISGLANVLQAVNNRLSTPVGSLIKQTAYGLGAIPGVAGTSYALSYLRMSYTASLLQDPRIERVENLKLEMNKDSVYISADLVLYGYDQSLPVTVQV